MSRRLSIATIIFFGLGIIAGAVAPAFCVSIDFMGTIYINLLKMMIVPVVLTSIASAIASSSKHATKITVMSIGIFVVMFVVSFLLCYSLWAVIRPGDEFTFGDMVWTGTLESVSLKDFLLNIFPSNIFVAASNNNLIQILLFSILFGVSIRTANCDGEIIKKLSDICNKMLGYIMYLTPIGVFALVGNLVASFGYEIIENTILYVGSAYLGCLLIEVVVMCVPVIICKVRLSDYFKSMLKIWTVSAATCSSAATLPTTIKICNEDFGVKKGITNIVVPLGCTIHMCGGAVSFSLLMAFNLQAHGVQIGWQTFLMMLVVALLLNMGAPGIPGGGIVIGAYYLSVFGIPLSFIGVYAGIYKALDAAYTTMNVSGDVTANIIINKLLSNYEKNKHNKKECINANK